VQEKPEYLITTQVARLNTVAVAVAALTLMALQR
jgi:hypothetical protein